MSDNDAAWILTFMILGAVLWGYIVFVRWLISESKGKKP
jgi:hypothetical protein